MLSDFMMKLMRLPISFFDSKGTGDILQRLQDHNRIQAFLSATTLDVLFSAVTFLIFGSIFFYFNAQLFFIFLLGSILYMGWVLLFLKQRAEIDYRYFDQAAGNQSSAIQLINGMQEIKLNGSEKRRRWEWEYISKRLPINQTEIAITANSTNQIQKRREISELDRQATEQKNQFKQATNTLISASTDWKKRYLSESPIAGSIRFSMILQENQLLRASTEIMYVGSMNANRYFGELRIPQANFGRVRTGQKVLVKFQGYPFEEFGAVEGTVGMISQIPSQDNTYFSAIVELPRGLQTNYGKNLSYKTGMEASAEIITEDLRLIERVFYQLRRVINQR